MSGGGLGVRLKKSFPRSKEHREVSRELLLFSPKRFMALSPKSYAGRSRY